VLDSAVLRVAEIGPDHVANFPWEGGLDLLHKRATYAAGVYQSRHVQVPLASRRQPQPRDDTSNLTPHKIKKERKFIWA
jgi:hypothetical protein